MNVWNFMNFYEGMIKRHRSYSIGDKGFTTLELLVVILVIGMLTAATTLAVSSLMNSGQVAAANTEVANVKTASKSYLVDFGTYPETTDNLTTGAIQYLEGTLKAKYHFGSDSGNITAVDTVSGGWTGMTFDETSQQWVK